MKAANFEAINLIRKLLFSLLLLDSVAFLCNFVASLIQFTVFNKTKTKRAVSGAMFYSFISIIVKVY